MLPHFSSHTCMREDGPGRKLPTPRFALQESKNASLSPGMKDRQGFPLTMPMSAIEA